VLRKLAADLAAEGSGYAHVPADLARSLLELPPVGGCSLCDAPLPPPARTGRPRSRCLDCSPRRCRKPSAMSTVAA
jgi:hypothetical protein